MNFLDLIGKFKIEHLIFPFLFFHIGIVNNNGLLPVSAEEVEEENSSTLQQVQLIFRHGLRAPEAPYPRDPYYNETLFWPSGFGHLTNAGKKQQYELGKYIRRRYTSLLPNGYSSRDFYAISSDSERCIMSALANLAGIFPPSSRDIWNEELDQWQPIPIYTIPRHLDKTIRGSASCPKFNELWTQLLMTSKEIKEFNEKNSDLYKLIGSHTGENYSYPINLTTFYEALIIQEAHNMTLPEWTNAVYGNKNSTDLLAFAFSLVVRTEAMKRLRGGPLLGEISENIQSFIDEAGPLNEDKHRKKKSKKVILYSGHDITLVRLMDTLNIFEPHLPDFNSMLMIELHKTQNQNQNQNQKETKGNGKNFYIEIFYRFGSFSNPVRMNIKGCPRPCYVDKFKTLFKHRIPTEEEWKLECALQSKNKPPSKFGVGFWKNVYEALRWIV